LIWCCRFHEHFHVVIQGPTMPLRKPFHNLNHNLNHSLLSRSAIAIIALSASTLFAQTATPAAPAAPTASNAASGAGAGKHPRGERLRALDTNKDQAISREEAKGHPRLEKHFDMIDANKDGQLSMEEMKAAHEARKAGAAGKAQ
jgi:hypothetical protein